MFLPACSRSDAPAGELFIISPHGSDIRREFQTAFSAWHQEHYGTPVKIQWPNIGSNGTGDIIKYLDAQYASRPTCDYDIVFGGGTASFDDFAARNYLVAPPLPENILNQVPPDIHGRSLHGPGNQWFAATMSSFGIVANKQRMAELHLPTPRVWEDLTTPEWFGQLSLADPSKSRSVCTCYDMVFQQYGWPRGWADLVLLFANAEAVREGGSHPADDTASAQAVAGIVIDFYGRNQIARVGKNIVTFIIPDGGSTIDPDPIAMLKGAPHPELAAHFIEFVISPAGQKIWTFRPHLPAGVGGPQRNALGRLSVLPSLYASDSAQMTDPTDPFTAAAPLKADPAAARTRTIFLGDLLKSALVDNHPALTQARKAVRDVGDPPDLLARLATLPTLPNLGTELHFAAPVPITAANLKDVAAAYKPADKTQLERNQAALKSHWQHEFATLFEQIRAAAIARAAGKTPQPPH